MAANIFGHAKIPFLRLLEWFSNLSKPKDSLLEITFDFDDAFCSINVATKEPLAAQDNLLIASFVLFVARYFYICDDRQIEPVKQFLLDNVGKQETFEALPGKIYELVFATLSSDERRASTTFFLLGFPPVVYTDSEKPRRSLSRYTFTVFRSRALNGQLASHFQMSLGPDKVLLPLTLSFFYQLVVDKLQDEQKREVLDRATVQLLESYGTVDCRAFSSLYQLPARIVESSGLMLSKE